VDELDPPLVATDVAIASPANEGLEIAEVETKRTMSVMIRFGFMAVILSLLDGGGEHFANIAIGRWSRHCTRGRG
jgi:hypothetical protein